MWSLKVGLHTTKEPTLRDLYVTLAVLPEVTSESCAGKGEIRPVCEQKTGLEEAG
jgi:hypothetical protein